MAKLWALYLLCLVPIIGADWQDIVKKECRHASDSDSFLQPGHVYKYRYHAVGSGAAVGTSDRSSEIILDCSVTVSAATGCLYNLVVASCKATAKGGPEGQKTAWIQDRDLSVVSEHPVLFSLNNGKLGSIFAMPADPLFSLNIKRGIISGFGISRSSADGEVKMHRDIHGTCPWIAYSHDNHISSSKQMLFCRHPSRPDWQLSPWSLFWNMTFMQPLINSSTECDYTINDAQNQLNKVSCHERHAAYIDSSQSTTNAVQTNIRYLLELESANKLLFKHQYQLNVMRATGIELEYEHTPEPQSQPHDFVKKAQKILSDLVLVSQDAVELMTIPLFHEFVAVLRTSSDIIPFIDTVTSCQFLEGVPRCNKHQKELALSYLKDAVMQCNTGACMGGFRHLVVRDQASRLYLTGAFLTWTNIPITNPTYIEEILAMCKHTEMKICWLALGTAIHKYSEDHSDTPQSVKDTVNHLSTYIGDECNVEDVTFPSHYTTADKHEYLLTVIKTIGNIGDVARSVHHGIVRQLYACASGKDSPQEIAIAAIKALNRMKPSNYIHKKLLFLLKDNQRSVGVRLASYDILLKLFQDDELAKEIASLLSAEKSTQVKCYIVTDIERIRGESDEKDVESFSYKLLEQLKDAGVYLEDFHCNSFHHSSSVGSSYFFNLNFLPEDMRRFGMQWDRKIVFDTISALPYSQTRNLTIELFSKLYNIIETGISAKNWEEFGIWVRRQLSDPNVHTGQWFVQNFIEVVRKLGIKGLIPLIPGSGEEELNFVYPEQRISENLKKIVKQFLQSHDKGKPSLEMYLKTFGNELGYVTLNGLFSFLTNQYQWLSNQNLGESLKKGITYNVTRALRLIEAFHHVPTLMGLPLTWSSRATYILSGRVSVDADLDSGERTENLHVEYSESFSLVNNMILELPSVTQVGVQANVSTHGSFDTHLTLYASDSKHLREITYKPTGKRQKYLEAYRTNQQIEHDRYEDIPDWTTNREEEKWCTSDRFNEIVGAKFCRERSYPVLPINMITSTFMAGSAFSKYYAEMVDRSLKEYKLSIIRPPIENGIYDLKLNFRAIGEKHRREAKVKLYVNAPTQESNFEIVIPELSDFEIKGARERIVNEDGVATGINHYWIIQTQKECRYEMKYKFNEETISKPEVRAARRRGKNEEASSSLQERTIDFQTPYNIYHWKSKLQKHENNVKAGALLTYENLKEEWKWPAEILAKSLWETDSKAWIQFDADWETQYNAETPDNFHRHSINTLTTPKRRLSIVSHRMKMPGRVIFEVNATVVEKENEKLLTFSNFSYNLWKSGSEQNNKEIRNLNLKIPHYTWNAHVERDESDLEESLTVKLDRSKEVASSEDETEAGGWWDHTHEGHVEEWTAKYRGHVKAERVENHLLPEDWRNTEYVKNKNQRYKGYNVILDVELTFPADGKEEAITVKGSSLRLYSDSRELPKKPTKTTDVFQWLDAEASDGSLVLHNTFTNNHREIRTITGARQGWVRRWISHKDNTVLSNGDELKYYLNLLWGEKERCEYAEFSHGYTSAFYSFDTDALLECKPRTKAYHIQLNSKATSEWDMLNSNFHFQFYLERHLEGWQTINFTHPALDFDSSAKIGMDLEGPYYNQEWVFKSKTDVLPSSNVKFSSKLTTMPYTELNISIPEEGIELMRLRTDIARDGSGYTATGYHIHTNDPGEEHQHSSFALKLLTPYKYSVRGYYNLEHIWTVAEWLHHKSELLQQKIEKIRNDENHPLNKLRKTIRKLVEKEEKHLQKVVAEADKNREEIRKLLYPFFEPTIEMIYNIRKKRLALQEYLGEHYSESPMPAYIEQLEITKNARETMENAPYFLMDAAKSYVGVDRNSRIIRFSYTGRHGFYWESLMHVPQTFEGTWRLPVLRVLPYINNEVLFKSRYIVPPTYKTAMIFGPLHVYTFDGKLYEFPDYPIPDCTYILLHDVRHQSFSVLTSAHKIHLLFPEMTVTIGQDEKIFVNNSRQQSEVPLESPNGKVAVTREGSIIVVETIGLKVLCDVPRTFCIFALDSLHHSGTMGLLGNADGEAFNDFMLPEGKSVETASEMARGYEVSNRKRCRQIQEKEKPQWNRDVQTRCADIFTYRFSVCASYLDIDEGLFKEACRWDAHQDKDVCSSPNALAGYCTVHGKKTAPCSPPQNWYLKTVNSAYKLEVIIVMDQYTSMFPGGLKGLESLLGAVEEEFTGKGYSSVLYSLIGFGGSGVRYHPHIQTSDTNIWHTQKDVTSSMMKTLKFNGQYRGNALEAVKYAATVLPFDMQSSRIMLLFTVDDVDSLFAGLKVKYLHSLLDSYSITLYTFADFPSIDKGKKLFGVRADGYIFPHPRKGDSYISFPTTEKAKLTSGTRGAIFLRRFAENNEPYAFFKMAAEEFHSKVGKEVSKCRKCIWKLNHWWDIQHECELSDDCRE